LPVGQTQARPQYLEFSGVVRQVLKIPNLGKFTLVKEGHALQQFFYLWGGTVAHWSTKR
jgi:hypothetical protein